ncbi:MAG: LysM peptidoglycan-binding domain-containing protein [Candidatus Levybacteria bacterium]|nr:LysM peptidoglycan-binding domain-containing protein [Candidatus Levybacteria bacterium]MBI2421146.1 LysM peptidoglycan-binding domain-containing protein [Candidatus Levybacteria bacterium]
MPRKKISKSSGEKESSVASKINESKLLSNYLSQIKTGESYVSLILGALVVLILAVVLFVFLRREGGFSNLNIDFGRDQAEKERQETTKRIYTVAEGEWLSTIALKEYGNIDLWREIAKANNISNPDLIEVGTKLVLPEIKSEQKAEAAPSPTVTPVPSTISTNTMRINSADYTVVEEDNLWDISVRAYGDGYKWSEVAKVNSLINPDVIVPGQKLNLPR